MKNLLAFVWILNQVRTILLAIWGCDIYLSSPSSFPFIFNFHANPGRFGSSEQMESWGGAGEKKKNSNKKERLILLSVWERLIPHLILEGLLALDLKRPPIFVGFLKRLIRKTPSHSYFPPLPLLFVFFKKLFLALERCGGCFSFFRIRGEATLRVP